MRSKGKNLVNNGNEQQHHEECDALSDDTLDESILDDFLLLDLEEWGNEGDQPQTKQSENGEQK